MAVPLAKIAACTLLVCSLISGCNRPTSEPSENSDPLLVVAHRGASAYAPEHTFFAWDLALEMGADYLEQDVQLTSDGVLIVLHDDTLNRTTTCPGLVREHAFEGLHDCDAGSWFNAKHQNRATARFADARIPTLDEVLTRYAGRTNFYIEIKYSDEAPSTTEALFELLDRRGLREPAAREWRVFIQSYDEKSLRRLHELDPRLPLIQLLSGRTETPRTIEAKLDDISEGCGSFAARGKVRKIDHLTLFSLGRRGGIGSGTRPSS